MTYHRRESSKLTHNRWFFLFAALLMVKICFYILDSAPLFFLGDSTVFLRTAVYNYIPLERSYVYGFIIKLVSYKYGTLSTLILLQTVAGALSAFMLVYGLISFLGLPVWLACIWGLFCALEPLQLLNERYVMTETFSLFFFALYLTLIFNYLKNNRLLLLGFIQLAGVIVVSLRLSYLPIIWLLGVLVPLLPFFCWKYLGDYNRPMSINQEHFPKTTVVHVLVSIVLMFSIHHGYKVLTGHLTHQKTPEYNYLGGIWLSAWFSPILEPVDFPDPKRAEEVFAVKYELKNRVHRAAQHVLDGGIGNNIKRVAKDLEDANKLAKQTVINAIIRDPKAAVGLVVTNYTDFWDFAGFRHWLKYDIGLETNGLPDSFRADLKEYFNFETQAEYLYTTTFVRKYYLAAWPWYLFFLCVPFISVVTLFPLKGGTFKYNFVICLSMMIVLGVTCSLTTHQYARYLHPISWLSFFTLGSLSHMIYLQVENRFNRVPS